MRVIKMDSFVARMQEAVKARDIKQMNSIIETYRPVCTVARLAAWQKIQYGCCYDAESFASELAKIFDGLNGRDIDWLCDNRQYLPRPLQDALQNTLTEAAEL